MTAPEQKSESKANVARILKRISDDVLTDAFDDVYTTPAKRCGIDTYEVVADEDERGKHVVVQVSAMADSPTYDKYALQSELQKFVVPLNDTKVTFMFGNVVMKSSFEYDVHYLPKG